MKSINLNKSEIKKIEKLLDIEIRSLQFDLDKAEEKKVFRAVVSIGHEIMILQDIHEKFKPNKL